jgi:hypothetical protein
MIVPLHPRRVEGIEYVCAVRPVGDDCECDRRRERVDGASSTTAKPAKRIDKKRRAWPGIRASRKLSPQTARPGLSRRSTACDAGTYFGRGAPPLATRGAADPIDRPDAPTTRHVPGVSVLRVLAANVPLRPARRSGTAGKSVRISLTVPSAFRGAAAVV